MNFLIVQLIGVIASITLMISYHQKEKGQILLVQIISLAAFTVHYYFLDGLTGAVCNAICLILFVIIYIHDKKTDGKNKGILIAIMIPALIFIAIFTWKNIFSILPIFASVIALIGFLLDDENTIRIIGTLCAISWLIYSIIYQSYSVIFFQTITIISTIIAIIKNRKYKEEIAEN